MSRPDWNEYFLQVATTVAQRASCLRRKCGAVFTRDHRILATGYNGAPPGMPQCDEVGCEMENGHCVRCTHAETNAIATAARFGVSLEGSTLYIHGGTPCYACAKVLLVAGVKAIFCDTTYPDQRSLDLFRQAGIALQVLECKTPTG